ncbi:MAG: imidazoleglycerol-phosphate dehydratase HisB [Planctomycetota bacterium]|jgi:imidazoleglycerol-phosphate dehydratase|nr:imidazoleglycerol-phosphate dehydratase HisB [Planctomycetota bacterium]
MAKRTASIKRSTAETRIELDLNLDGSGAGRIDTGVGFFDHMLTLLARHALFDLTITAKGDTHVDAHHTVEDVGICLGQALAQALGDKKGIARYGFFLLPMDESLARIALDLSGRPFMEWRAEMPAAKCGDFDACLAREFMWALCCNGGVTMHVDLLAARETHHALEAIFKGVARSLRIAAAMDARETGIPSSKGKL